MMRRLYVTLMFCAVFLSVVSTPAHAVSLEWIDHLSGPGPFWGVEHEFRVWCFGGEKVEKLVGGKGGCISGTKTKHKGSINFTAAYAFGRKNDLSYQAPQVSKRVDILRLGPSFEWALLDRTLELSAGLELDSFLGSGFDNFSRLAVPLMIDFKPFVTDRNNTKWNFGNVVTLRAGVLIIPATFDATDFNAKAGTFHSSSEVLPTVSLIFDLGHRQ